MRFLNVSCNSTDWRIQYTKGNWSPVQANSTPSFLAVDQATVSFDFNGTFISVLGSLASAESKAIPSVTYFLDGNIVAVQTTNSSSDSNSIYSSPILPQGLHNLRMVSNNNETRLSIEGMIFTTESTSETVGPSETRKMPTAAIIGGTVGAAVLLLAVGIFVFFIYRRRRQKQQTTAFASGPLRVSLPSSKKSFTSRNRGNYGISFYSANEMSSDSLTPIPAKISTRRTSEWVGFTKK